MLLASDVSFNGLDGRMSQQELDLLQFAARGVAQPSPGPPEVVGANPVQCQAWFRAVPVHEFIDSMLIPSAGLERCEALRTDLLVRSSSGKVGRAVRDFLRFVRFMRGGLGAAASLLYAAE